MLEVEGGRQEVWRKSKEEGDSWIQGSWSEAAEEKVRCWPMIGCGPNLTPRGGESSSERACFLHWFRMKQNAGPLVRRWILNKTSCRPASPESRLLSLFQLRSGDLAASKPVLPGFYF